eukprot:gb/GEZJ01000397.1/.p1 GENE.gb/GEZJ01000397.1/~~gb/GEZJ01000397.1/.p1  ORF type:complete len:392 (+),score=36.46 gb/GEZJ01000397.1/:512-1687(+)
MSFKQISVLVMVFVLIAPTKAAVIDGEYVIQLEGTCNPDCRDALQQALDNGPDTAGCSLAATGSQLGGFAFEFVSCPTAAGVELAVVSGIVFAQSSTGQVPTVQLVEQNVELTTQATSTSLWGIDETDGGVKRNLLRNPVRDGLRTCSMSSNNGAGVNVWILDTGCTPINGGLCTGFHGGANLCEDNYGHGEHVGGTATDSVFGVAFGAARSCVKVLDDSGGGSVIDVIKGIEFVGENLNLFGKGDVINLSLGGLRLEVLNNAVKAVRDLGVYFSIAAGNGNDNACNYSPASAEGPGIFTVQAHTENLKKASFSNYATVLNSCTTLTAPGVDIESVNGIASGTSMAAPHVAGACAVLLADDKTPTKALLTAKSVIINPLIGLRRRTLGLGC